MVASFFFVLFGGISLLLAIVAASQGLNRFVSFSLQIVGALEVAVGIPLALDGAA